MPDDFVIHEFQGHESMRITVAFDGKVGEKPELVYRIPDWDWIQLDKAMTDVHAYIKGKFTVMVYPTRIMFDTGSEAAMVIETIVTPRNHSQDASVMKDNMLGLMKHLAEKWQQKRVFAVLTYNHHHYDIVVENKNLLEY